MQKYIFFFKKDIYLPKIFPFFMNLYNIAINKDK